MFDYILEIRAAQFGYLI